MTNTTLLKIETLPIVSSIESYAKELALTIYPNPVTEQFKMSFYLAQTALARLTIMDAIGKKLEEKTYNLLEGEQQLIINTKKLPLGQYFIQISTIEGVYKGSFVKVD